MFLDNFTVAYYFLLKLYVNLYLNAVNNVVYGVGEMRRIYTINPFNVLIKLSHRVLWFSHLQVN